MLQRQNADIHCVVGVSGFKLNRELAKFLCEHPTYHEQTITEPSASYHAPKWRVRDRLTEEDITEFIAAFKAGTAKHVLAKRYRINEKSVKQLLREYGVKKRHQYDIQP